MTDFAVVGAAHQAWRSSAHGSVNVLAVSFGNVGNPKHVVEHANSIGVFLVGGGKVWIIQDGFHERNIVLTLGGGGTPGSSTSICASMDPK